LTLKRFVVIIVDHATRDDKSRGMDLFPAPMAARAIRTAIPPRSKDA
jgi:hypothetical protein